VTSPVKNTVSNIVDPYVPAGGIFHPPPPVTHRDDDYDSPGYEMLRHMQARHFWYRGRHRFLLAAMARCPLTSDSLAGLRVIDIGGGCGGWMADLIQSRDTAGAELAIAESSLTALDYASQVLPPSVRRYRVDLLNLQWRNRWDVVFLLDVLKHISEHVKTLQQVWISLVPGGLLFVTTPALMQFWSWNDELALHRRRYSRRDFASLAAATGFRLHDARYFIFFLSPLLLASRWLSRRKAANLPKSETYKLMRAMHRVPSSPVNLLLRGILSAKSPLGHYVRFPWGTSILGIFQKPECCE